MNNDKELHSNEAEISSEHPKPVNASCSKKVEGSEDIRVQIMEMEIPPVESFTPLEAAAVSCVLQECLEQLATIEFIIPANVDPRWNDTLKTIDEMYGIPDEPRMIFLEDMGLLPLTLTAAEKMQKDRDYAYKVFERVLRNVKENRRFDSLQEEIDNIAKKQEVERNLEMNARIWLSQAEQLQKLLESDKIANEDDKKKMMVLAHESEAQVDHAIFLNSGKRDYTEKWAKARLEQQEIQLTLQKTDMLNQLNDYSTEYSTEQVISTEITAYLEADMKKKEEQIVTWTKRYNEEFTQRQREIDELQKKIEKQKFEIKEMRALIDERQEFIDECIAEETRLQEEAKLQERLNRAATIIQSVWRAYIAKKRKKKAQIRKKKKSAKKR